MRAPSFDACARAGTCSKKRITIGFASCVCTLIAVALGLPCAAGASEYTLTRAPASYVLGQSTTHTGIALAVSVRSCRVTARVRVHGGAGGRVHIALRGRVNRTRTRVLPRTGRVVFTFGQLPRGRYRVTASYPGARATGRTVAVRCRR